MNDTTAATIHAFIGTAYNLSYADFCRAIDNPPDAYAEGKYRNLQAAAKALASFGPDMLGRIAAAGEKPDVRRHPDLVCKYCGVDGWCCEHCYHNRLRRIATAHGED